MRVRPLLALLIDAAAAVLHHIGRRAEAAVALHRQNRSIAALIIRHQQPFSRAV